MTTLKKNFFLDTDSYKYGHFLQYPPGTTNISSYIEAREGPDEIVFFGLQMWMLDNITGYIVKMDDIIDAEIFAKEHGDPFNYEDMLKLVGKSLPLRIEAVKEGTVLAPSNVMVQVTNTTGLPSRWLTSFIETSILRGVWYPTTVATLSREIKKLIKKYLEETGTPELLNYKLHDFGFRGVSSYESGCIGALAHLVNFRGSDTMGANVYGKAFYKERTAGTSIPAAEHSTITSWGTENEAKAYRNMIEKFGGPGKMYAVVSDSYDIYNAVSEIWGKELQAEVRAKGGVLVVRPDSGHPATVVLEVVKALGDAFGYEENAKGYKVLDPCVRVIQGDGINIDSIEEILETLKTSGWSADNVAFGMGGALLQKMDRDTFSFAMKASAISYDDGETWGDVKKNPITQALKKSKGGRLALIKEDGKFKTIRFDDLKPGQENFLELVWEDGKTYRTQTLEEIRKLAEV